MSRTGTAGPVRGAPRETAIPRAWCHAAIRALRHGTTFGSGTILDKTIDVVVDGNQPPDYTAPPGWRA
jgi:hypothetical protein